MSRQFQPPPRDVVAEVERHAGRTLSVAEFDAYVGAPISERERAEILALVDWFRRRYPTPAARFAYARRAFRRSVARCPGTGRSGR